MTQRTVVLLVAAAVIFAAAVAGQADDALRWRIKQLQAEVSRLQAQGAGQAQLAAELDSERGRKDAALRTLASVQEQLRDAQASLVQGQEREDALQRALAEARGRLSRAESEVADTEAARHTLARVQSELSNALSELAAEREGHRSARSMLAGVRQALEQASAAVVKLRFAHSRQDRENATAQAELQGALSEAQERQWQAEADLAQLRQSRSDAEAELAAELGVERNRKDDALETLASVQEQFRDAQASLVRGQEREDALQQELSGVRGRLARAESEVADVEATRQALATAEEDLAGARSALDEEREGHRSARSMLAGVRQALEQASAAVVKLRFAHSRQDRENAAAQAELQGALSEAQQRQWQAEADLAQLRQSRAAAVESERALKDAARRDAASTLQQLRDAQAAMVQRQEREAALQQALAGARGRLSAAEARLGDEEATRQALATSRDALAAARSALEGEREGHRSVKRSLAAARLAQEQASAAVAQLQFAQAGRNEANAAVQADLRQELVETQQRHWQAEETIVSLRRELSQAQGDASRLRQTLAEEEARGEAARLSLASTREDLARNRRALEQERNNNAAQGQVLANTQAALSETGASLAQARAAMAEQVEAHAGEREAAQSAKQEWVERYWDMEQQRLSTRAALRKEEMAHQETLQALDKSTRQARLDGIRMSQLSRDASEARESLQRAMEPSAQARALADLVRQRFGDEIQQGRMTLRVGRRGVKLSSAHMFDFSRAVEPGTQSVSTLNRIADILQEVPSHRVRFAVHTDNIPLRQGSRWPTNWELSTARAAKLARYLIVDKGVPGERLSIAGYGEYRPVADNSTREGRRQNRRVEVTIKAPRNK